jgi:hypothetical protein
MFQIASIGVLAIIGFTPVQSSSQTVKEAPQKFNPYEAVEALRVRSMVVGYPNGRFDGNSPITRYEVTSILNQLTFFGGCLGGPTSKAPDFFKDVRRTEIKRVEKNVPRPHWAYEVIDNIFEKRAAIEPIHWGRIAN